MEKKIKDSQVTLDTLYWITNMLKILDVFTKYTYKTTVGHEILELCKQEIGELYVLWYIFY